jgi:hypothetical protein
MAKTVKQSGTTTKAATTRKPATRKTAEAKVTETPINYEQVALLAYKFWIERGRVDGHHEEDWYRAEQELRAKKA